MTVPLEGDRIKSLTMSRLIQQLVNPNRSLRSFTEVINELERRLELSEKPISSHDVSIDTWYDLRVAANRYGV